MTVGSDTQMRGMDSDSRSVAAWLSSAVVITLAVLVALASTTGVGMAASWFDEQRILALVVLVTAGLFVRLLLPVPRRDAAAAMLAVLALGVLSCTLAVRPYIAAVEWSVYCLMGFLIVSARVTGPRRSRGRSRWRAPSFPRRLSPASWPTSVGAAAGFPRGCRDTARRLQQPPLPRAVAGSDDSPTSAGDLQRAPSTFWRACLAVVAALWWMCIIGSGSRAGLDCHLPRCGRRFRSSVWKDEGG